MPTTSIREIARGLGLSHTTVSEALRDNPRVRKETREKVQKAALKEGYHYNPLAGALMSEMRRKGSSTFRGMIAIVDLEGDKERKAGERRYHHSLVTSASETADRLGFKVDLIVLEEPTKKISIPRLNTILRSRGIHGILVLPVASTPDFQNLDWDHFAGVYLDYLIDRPAIDAVCSDHFRSMVIGLRKLQGLGYRRPGLILHEPHDRRLLFRWEAAFNTYTRHQEDLVPIEPFIRSSFKKEEFLEWFAKMNPDVVVSHHDFVISWMEEGGASVPGTHGFCSLNVLRSSVPAAGLDLRPDLIGTKGMELLIGQLHRNQYGIPEFPSITTIPAVWHPGPTLKEYKKKAGCRSSLPGSNTTSPT